VVGAVLALAFWVPTSEAQYYPGKTVEMIISTGVGGGMIRMAQRFNQVFKETYCGQPKHHHQEPAR